MEKKRFRCRNSSPARPRDGKTCVQYGGKITEVIDGFFGIGELPMPSKIG